MSPVSSVVAIRYHNSCARFMLSKPTISIGYSPSMTSLMAEMGLPEFCQAVASLDVARLIEQFADLESRSAELKSTIAERRAAQAEHLAQQFTELSALLFGGSKPPAAAERKHASRGAR